MLLCYYVTMLLLLLLVLSKVFVPRGAPGHGRDRSGLGGGSGQESGDAHVDSSLSLSLHIYVCINKYIYIYIYIHIYIYIYMTDFIKQPAHSTGRNRFDSFRFWTFRKVIGSVRKGTFPVRCSSVYVFRSRRVSVQFGSVRFRVWFWLVPETVRFGSVWFGRCGSVSYSFPICVCQ